MENRKNFLGLGTLIFYILFCLIRVPFSSTSFEEPFFIHGFGIRLNPQNSFAWSLYLATLLFLLALLIYVILLQGEYSLKSYPFYATIKDNLLRKRESIMAFGEEKHKKTTFEKVTLIIVVLMVLATVAGLVLPAISALM